MPTGIETFAVVAAIPGLIDLSIKYGEFLEKKVELFMSATEHSRLQGFVLELCTGGINDMLIFFKEVHTQLDKAFQIVLRDSLKILNDALEKALEAFPDDSFADEMKTMGKLKYAFYNAKRIEQAVKEMELWQDRFTKRAEIHLRFVFYPKYGINMAQQPDNTDSPSVSSAEIQSIHLEDSDKQQLLARLKRIEKSRRQGTGSLLISSPPKIKYSQLPNSSLWNAAEEHISLSLVEYRSYNAADAVYIKALNSTVRNVAAKLREANDSTMHILNCQGFSDHPIEKRFALYFSSPAQKKNPRSLRTLLADPRNASGRKHSLSNRLQLAQSIATAVLYVHSCDFVHKNIRPENIIIFDDVSDDTDATQTYPYVIGQPYLAGYDGVRKEEASTLMLEVTKWNERVYLPLERLTGKEHRAKFSWRHDVYSLGVVLLEIALWENFANPSGRIGKELSRTNDPEAILNPYLKQVPRLLGDKYGEAVSACFGMLKSSDVNKEIEDEDGIGMGTTFISRVLDKLEDIRL